MIGNGCSAYFLHDPCLSNLTLGRWPIFVNMEIRESTSIFDLLHSEGSGWHPDHVAQHLGPDLAKRVLSIAIPTHDSRDARVWRFSYEQRVGTGDLYAIYY